MNPDPSLSPSAGEARCPLIKQSEDQARRYLAPRSHLSLPEHTPGLVRTGWAGRTPGKPGASGGRHRPCVWGRDRLGADGLSQYGWARALKRVTRKGWLRPQTRAQLRIPARCGCATAENQLPSLALVLRICTTMGEDERGACDGLHPGPHLLTAPSATLLAVCLFRVSPPRL